MQRCHISTIIVHRRQKTGILCLYSDHLKTGNVIFDCCHFIYYFHFFGCILLEIIGTIRHRFIVIRAKRNGGTGKPEAGSNRKYPELGFFPRLQNQQQQQQQQHSIQRRYSLKL